MHIHTHPRIHIHGHAHVYPCTQTGTYIHVRTLSHSWDGPGYPGDEMPRHYPPALRARVTMWWADNHVTKAPHRLSTRREPPGTNRSSRRVCLCVCAYGTESFPNQVGEHSCNSDVLIFRCSEPVRLKPKPREEGRGEEEAKKEEEMWGQRMTSSTLPNKGIKD